MRLFVSKGVGVELELVDEKKLNTFILYDQDTTFYFLGTVLVTVLNELLLDFWFVSPTSTPAFTAIPTTMVAIIAVTMIRICDDNR